MARPIGKDTLCHDLTELYDRIRRLEAQAPDVFVDANCCIRWRCQDTAEWVVATESGVEAYTAP